MRAFASRVLGGVVTAGLTLPPGFCGTLGAAEADKIVTVIGTVTQEGVTCRAMRGDDGVLYTFRRTALTRQFVAGERIRLEGTVETVSICQQGTTIVVTRAVKAE